MEQVHSQRELDRMPGLQVLTSISAPYLPQQTARRSRLRHRQDRRRRQMPRGDTRRQIESSLA